MKTAARLAAIWLLALSPTVLFLAFWSILDPASFWEGFALIAIGLVTLGPIQLIAIGLAVFWTVRE